MKFRQALKIQNNCCLNVCETQKCDIKSILKLCLTLHALLISPPLHSSACPRLLRAVCIMYFVSRKVKSLLICRHFIEIV